MAGLDVNSRTGKHPSSGLKQESFVYCKYPNAKEIFVGIQGVFRAIMNLYVNSN